MLRSTLFMLAQAVALALAANNMDHPAVRVVAREDSEDKASSNFSPVQINSALAKRSTCGYAAYIDVFFDVNLDGSRFAKCLNVPIKNWSRSKTPNDFAWCRKEWTRCSQSNKSHVSGVCVRGNVFCGAAEQYCNTLQGKMLCSG
ncbi:hypothetical protein HGRIS_002854 [Hohenbuehelia grisea]|uniref:Uncharacterized protein n=1 Tax=Hohenbuehelia grisea TaxID=104357 RepID=A0ABR3JLQ6_9AGAR